MSPFNDHWFAQLNISGVFIRSGSDQLFQGLIVEQQLSKFTKTLLIYVQAVEELGILFFIAIKFL